MHFFKYLGFLFKYFAPSGFRMWNQIHQQHWLDSRSIQTSLLELTRFCKM